MTLTEGAALQIAKQSLKTLLLGRRIKKHTPERTGGEVEKRLDLDRNISPAVSGVGFLQRLSVREQTRERICLLKLL